MNLPVELNEAQAWALAQFLKRLRWDCINDLAAHDDEAEQMSLALHEIRCALDKKGISPR